MESFAAWAVLVVRAVVWVTALPQQACQYSVGIRSWVLVPTERCITPKGMADMSTESMKMACSGLKPGVLFHRGLVADRTADRGRLSPRRIPRERWDWGRKALASVQAPGPPATTVVHRADGLLASLTDPNGNQHQFTYDDRGLLTRDDNGSGGFTTLVRATTDSSSSVTLTTAMGATTTH